ncbi:PH domain-containing protein [candidate division WWE3 bacterium]|nr:PH domain-containing protein [candidate division WWE3 bacterium]
MWEAFWRYPKSTHFDGEDSGEEILLVLRRHLITNLGWIVVSIALVILPTVSKPLLLSLGIGHASTFSPSFTFILTSFWYLFAFGFIFENFLLWFFNVYIVTNKRIVDMDFGGILFRNISDAPLRNIEDVTHTISGAAQVIFNYGNVAIQTAGEQRELEFELVPRPARVQDIISDLAAGRSSDI